MAKAGISDPQGLNQMLFSNLLKLAMIGNTVTGTATLILWLTAKYIYHNYLKPHEMMLSVYPL